MASPAEHIEPTKDPLSDTGITRALSADGKVAAEPAVAKPKPTGLAVIDSLDPIEDLAIKLGGAKHLRRVIETLDSYIPTGFDGLVEAMNANMPRPSFLTPDILRRFAAEGWFPVVERKPAGEIVIAIKAQDEKGMIRSPHAVSLPIIDKLDRWMKDAKLDHRLVLLLLSGSDFEKISEFALNDSKRRKHLGELDSIESARENFYAILERAVKQGATDIHIEAVDSKEYRIRYRIDGVLQHDGRTIPAERGKALVRAIKVMGNMTSDDPRKPWDGSINPSEALLKQLPFMQGRSLRISTMPTLIGDDGAIRIMQSAEVSSLKLGDLNLPKVVETRLRRLIEAPNGVILVAGPTGSGKSTTLAAALRELNKSDTKIVTLEDPVEQLMPGVIQSPMASGLGYTFANALRSTLRHDPDVILVGEVRDAETAQVMTQGANTGHLLLSTIHTNDSISVFKRLRELGIDESQISASLLGVLSQRLVRCLCGGCKEKYSPLQELTSLLASGGARLSETEGRDLADSLTGLEFWRVGSKERLAACRECRGRGYKGRVAIPELWVIGEGERDLISRGETGHRALLDAAIVGGMVPMSISGLDYVVAGVTDLAELKTNVFRPDELISKRREFIKYFGALKRSS